MFYRCEEKQEEKDGKDAENWKESKEVEAKDRVLLRNCEYLLKYMDAMRVMKKRSMKEVNYEESARSRGFKNQLHVCDVPALPQHRALRCLYGYVCMKARFF